MSDAAIIVEGLSKRYRLGAISRHTLVEEAEQFFLKLRGKSPTQTGTVGQNGTPSPKEFWALQDVSFEVNQGEAIGLIGGNGAGKSTLLKVLSRITEPTSGSAQLRGRVGSLLEVGTGFHPELTGRENVFMNGTLLGMTKREVSAKFDEIVDFSGVGKFIDTPVKRYSSGMYVRLAFAVAAHLEPEILIVDEVLAVGDADFQKKCLGKMGEVAQGGRTVLFVSHNMTAVENLCGRCLWMDHGQVRQMGTSHEVVQEYLEHQTFAPGKIPIAERTDRLGTGEIKIMDIEFRDIDGNPISTLHSGQSFSIVMKVSSPTSSRKLQASFSLQDSMNRTVWLVRSTFHHADVTVPAGTSEIQCQIEDFALGEGSYHLTAFLAYGRNHILDCVSNAVTTSVAGGDFFHTGQKGLPELCPVLTRSQWETQS